MAKTKITIQEQLLPISEASSGLGEIAIILNTTRGRTDKVYTIKNIGELTAMFGASAENASYIQSNGPKSLAIAEKLLKNGCTLKAVRLAGAADTGSLATASLTIGKSANTVSLTIKSRAEGTGYNGMQIKFKPQVIRENTTSKFTTYFSVEVLDKNGTVLETASKISFDPEDAYYIKNAFDSEYVVIDSTIVGTYASLDVTGETPTASLASGANYGEDTNMTSSLGLLQNKDITFSIFVIPGSYGSDACALAKTLLEARQDCLFVFDTVNPYGATYEATEAKTNVVNCAAALGDISDYAATTFPCTSGAEGRFPCWVDYAILLSKAHRDNVYYKAPAGLLNGLLGSGRPVMNLTLTEIEDLQEANVNPVIIKNGACAVWGNATLAQSTSQISGVAIRLVVNALKRRAYEVSQRYLFELHNEATWNKWKGDFEPHVRALFDAGAISNYSIVMDRSIMTDSDIANGILKGLVIIQPVASIEQIYITFTVDETGVLFE